MNQGQETNLFWQTLKTQKGNHLYQTVGEKTFRKKKDNHQKDHLKVEEWANREALPN